MSIINSSTTGHSGSQERKFSYKLFGGLTIVVIVAIAFFLAISQHHDLKTAPAEGVAKPSDSTPPQPVSDQPQN